MEHHLSPPFFTTMLLSNIASMEAFNQLPDGKYDNLQDELQAFAGAIATAKNLKTKLSKNLTEFNTRIDGQAEARVSILAKGAETDVQFAPTVAFKLALESIVTAVNTFETSLGAIDLPTA
jgi:hypothetical protein